jgi:hypothetical protein
MYQQMELNMENAYRSIQIQIYPDLPMEDTQIGSPAPAKNVIVSDCAWCGS